MELGRCAVEHLLALQPENHRMYVLISNIYIDSGMSDEVKKLRTMMKDWGLQ